MTTIRYKGRKRATQVVVAEIAADFAPALKRMAAGPSVADDIRSAGHLPPKPKVAWPKKKQHPRDRLNEQLRTKASRTREVKHLSTGKPREERIAILVDIGRKRGTGVLLTEIETHERKIADLREAVAKLTGE